jgi:hypothetical protein
VEGDGGDVHVCKSCTLGCLGGSCSNGLRVGMV